MLFRSVAVPISHVIQAELAPETSHTVQPEPHLESVMSPGVPSEGLPIRPDGRMPLSPAEGERLLKTIETATKPHKPVRFIHGIRRLACLQAVVIPAIVEAARQLKRSDGPAATSQALTQLLKIPRAIAEDSTVSEATSSRPARRKVNPFRPQVQADEPEFIRRAAKAARDGDLRKAMTALENKGAKAPTSLHTIMMAASKHPTSPAPTIGLTTADIAKVPEISAKLIKKIVRGTPRNRAAGQSGWTWELLRYVIAVPEGSTALRKLVNALAAGMTGAHGILLTCGLTLLDKPGGGIRPVAVAEPICSLVSKCLAFAVKAKMQKRFAPIQFAGGLSRGVECAIHAVKMALGKNPDNVLCSVDISNAFNEGLRQPMLKGVRDQFPEVYPWMRYMYSAPTPLRLDGARMMDSASGQRQGDALSMLAFCESLHPILMACMAACPLVDIVAYADDVKIVGRREACSAFFDLFSDKCSAIGLKVNQAKTEWYTPATDPGIELFGAPVGSDMFIAEHIKNKVAVFHHQADLCVEGLSAYGYTQEADQLLRRSLRPSIDAYLRVVELPIADLDCINTWLLSSIQAVLHLPKLSYSMMARRPKDGGLSFGPVANSAGEAREKVKKQLEYFGVNISHYTEYLAAFNAISRGPPARVGKSKFDTPPLMVDEHAPFSILPQWINSCEQVVDPQVYITAMQLQMGLAKLPQQRPGQRRSPPPMTQMSFVRQAWIALELNSQPPLSLDPKTMTRAVAGLSTIPRLHLSYAFMQDTVRGFTRLQEWRQSIATTARSSRIAVQES